jgi:hypothetical protein
MVTRQQNLQPPIVCCVIKWLQENAAHNGCALPDQHFLLGMAYSVIRCRSQIYCCGSLHFVVMAQDSWPNCVVCGNSRGHMSYAGVGKPYFFQWQFLLNWKHITKDSLVILVTRIYARRQGSPGSIPGLERGFEEYFTVQRAERLWWPSSLLFKGQEELCAYKEARLWPSSSPMLRMRGAFLYKQIRLYVVLPV